MKIVFRLIAAGVVLFFCPSVFSASPVTTVSPVKRPNVLFMIMDDLRPTIGAYGDKRAITPNLDKLASQGMLFKKAYTNMPVCGASRASFMTSIYPTPKRFTSFLSMASVDAPGAVSLPQMFKEAGYHTISNGKVFHNSKDLNKESWTEPAWRPATKQDTALNPESKRYIKPNATKGDKGPWYESADEPDEAYSDGKLKEKTIADLQRLAKQDKPFFMTVGFYRPHLPFYAPEKYYQLYKNTEFLPFFHRVDPDGAPASLKGSEEILLWHFKDYVYNSDRFHTASLLGYYASVSHADQQLGDVLAELDRLHLRDNTIVVLIGDHGFNLGEHNYWTKHNLMHPSVHIPLIVDVPGKQQGKVSQSLVSLIDLFPTLADLAGIKANDRLQQQWAGRSFASLFDHPNAEHTPFIYSRYGNGDTIITPNLIYTEYTTPEGGESMLYDLVKDPFETKNVVKQPAYAKEVARLSAELRAFMEKQANTISSH